MRESGDFNLTVFFDFGKMKAEMGYKFGHQVGLLALIENLATRMQEAPHASVAN